MNNIVKYLDHILPFVTPQIFTDNEIFDPVEFALSCECHKQLCMKISNLTTNSLNKLVELCDQLDMSEVISHDKCDDAPSNKNPISAVQATNHSCWIIAKVQTIS